MPKRTRTPAQEQAEALRAFTLHSQGLTEARIAEVMTTEGQKTNPDYKISQPTVHRRIKSALESYAVPALEDAKKAELQRIDGVLAAMSESVASGDAKAASVVLKAIQVRAAILGLDAPKKVETTETPTLVHPFAAQLAAKREAITRPAPREIEG